MSNQAYDQLAPYYDAWQDSLRDPEDWADLALALYEEVHGSTQKPLKILDFGCGSGSVAQALAERGHYVTGLDLSEGMIKLALERQVEEGSLRFIVGDLNQFDPAELSPGILHDPELDAGYDVIIAYLETFNHFPDIDSLEDIYRSLAKQLAPRGLMLFDVLREDYMLEVLPDLAFGEVLDETDSVYLIWENETLFDPLRNRAKLTFFMEEEGGLFKRTPRVVEEWYYSAEQLQAALATARLELIGEIDPLAFVPLEEDSFFSSDRHFYVVKSLD